MSIRQNMLFFPDGHTGIFKGVIEAVQRYRYRYQYGQLDRHGSTGRYRLAETNRFMLLAFTHRYRYRYYRYHSNHTGSLSLPAGLRWPAESVAMDQAGQAATRSGI